MTDTQTHPSPDWSKRWTMADFDFDFDCSVSPYGVTILTARMVGHDTETVDRATLCAVFGREYIRDYEYVLFDLACDAGVVGEVA